MFIWSTPSPPWQGIIGTTERHEGSTCNFLSPLIWTNLEMPLKGGLVLEPYHIFPIGLTSGSERQMEIKAKQISVNWTFLNPKVKTHWFNASSVQLPHRESYWTLKQASKWSLYGFSIPPWRTTESKAYFWFHLQSFADCNKKYLINFLWASHNSNHHLLWHLNAACVCVCGFCITQHVCLSHFYAILSL